TPRGTRLFPGSAPVSQNVRGQGIEARRGGYRIGRPDIWRNRVAAKSRGDRQIRFARILGLAFIVAGFVAIGIGWSGAARVDWPGSQFPYFLSAGATGLGLIGVGCVA